MHLPVFLPEMAAHTVSCPLQAFQRDFFAARREHTDGMELDLGESVTVGTVMV